MSRLGQSDISNATVCLGLRLFYEFLFLKFCKSYGSYNYDQYVTAVSEYSPYNVPFCLFQIKHPFLSKYNILLLKLLNPSASLNFDIPY